MNTFTIGALSLILTLIAGCIIFVIAARSEKRDAKKYSEFWAKLNAERKKSQTVRFTTTADGVVAPSYGSLHAAGADLRALLDEPIVIQPNESRLIHTGIAMAIPAGYVGLVYARSGIACKRGLAPSNKVGVIDADYRGEIMISLHNHGTTEQIVEPSERIAQIVITPYMAAQFEQVESLDDTERGGGGFGSTGTK